MVKVGGRNLSEPSISTKSPSYEPALGQPLEATLAETMAGWVGLVFSRRGLVALRFPSITRADAMAALRAEHPGLMVLAGGAWGHLKAQLARFYEGQTVRFDVPCDLSGHTHFQRSVWEITASIPYGETRSYGWVAREIGAPKAYRAVGAALGANPIPIIIPCHRVLRTDGRLGGYRGGLAMKQRLLSMEKGVAVSQVKELR